MADLSTPSPASLWVRWWFRGAAIYGAVALLATLLRAPPAASLYFYGFAGTALAFQLVFWIIGGDPVRYRPMMIAGVGEKLAFVLPALALASAGGLGATMVGAALIDLVLGIGFAVAWWVTPPA